MTTFKIKKKISRKIAFALAKKKKYSAGDRKDFRGFKYNRKLGIATFT